MSVASRLRHNLLKEPKRGAVRKAAAIDHYWARDPSTVLTLLHSGPNGISDGEAARRAARDVAPPTRGNSPGRLLLRQFTSPLVAILIFATCVSLVAGEWIDAIIILLIVAGSGILGFTQEYRASRAIDELRQRLAQRARVVRDGVEKQIGSEEVVVGDVLLLGAGNVAAADGIVLQSTGLLLDEATLTGESFPAEKSPGRVSAQAALTARTNCVFQGTAVRGGTGRILVAATGADTVFGGLRETLEAAEARTEFARGLDAFGLMLVRIMLAVVALVLVVALILHRPLVESLLFAIALAVAISPELLPAVVSVTLATGAREMAEHGVLVRRLEAIENFGSMDVLCTDKTGTLTEGVISLSAAVDTAGRPAIEVLRLAALNATLQSAFQNPLDQAIATAAKALPLDISAWRKLGEVPYDFARRRLTVTAKPPKGRAVVICKGAVREVLDQCASVRKGRRAQPLDPERRQQLERFTADKGGAGFRLLAVSTGREGRAVLEGFLLFFDPPKKGIRRTIADLKRHQISVKIISGDNRYVTEHLAARVGLGKATLLTGEQLAALDDTDLARMAEGANVFAEIEPEQKVRILQALQRNGHSVGYMGDGINDAPALRTADIGISVDRAVDVARDSADIVLLRSDLNILRRGVEDGRQIFANTLKYISVTISANFGNMVSMAVATVVLPFLPLLPTQVLLNNFLSDLPAATIARDDVDPERLTTAQRWDIGQVRRFMIVFGLASTCFDLLTFALLVRIFGAPAPLFRTTWFVVSLLTEILALLILRTRRPSYASRPSPLLLWSSIFVGMLALCLPFTGPIAALAGLQPLSFALTGTALLIVAAYGGVTELMKRLFFGPPRPAAAH